jgi:hypothetical protein
MKDRKAPSIRHAQAASSDVAPAEPGVRQVAVNAPVKREQNTISTPKPPACINIMSQDGEHDSSGWEAGNTPRTAVYLGDGHMRLGIPSGVDAYSYSSMHQDVAIPGGVHQVSLSFRYLPVSVDVNGGDKFQALVLSTDNQLLVAVLNNSSAASWVNTQAWAEATQDITDLAGRTVRIYFNCINDGDGQLSHMDVKDVSVLVCQ